MWQGGRERQRLQRGQDAVQRPQEAGAAGDQGHGAGHQVSGTGAAQTRSNMRIAVILLETI